MMKKKSYITPLAEVVRLNVSEHIAEDPLSIGSEYVDSSELDGKETDFDEEAEDGFGFNGNSDFHRIKSVWN